MRRGLLRTAGILLGVLLGAELVLQAAAALVPDRAGAWRPDAEVRVLAVGDSHTYGAYVDAAESYPAQLQQLLDERAPGRFSVINLGIPGLSSSQVLDRLVVQVSRYAPDLVIVWCGSNDAWNRVDVGREPSLLGGLAHHSRLYRLARVRLHDRGLERSASATRADGTHQDSDVDLSVEGRQTWRLRHGGIVETLRNDRAPTRAGEAMIERLYRAYRGMEAWLSAAGVPVILVQYPLHTGAYRQANRALQRAAQVTGVPLVDSAAALARVPEADRRWEQGRHPTGPIYREIAAEIVPLVLEIGERGAAERAPSNG